MAERLDTFPRLLLHHAAARGDHPAIREKDLGIWQAWTWAQVAAEVRALACGLAAQGFKRGMSLAIVGENRPRLYWAVAAVQCLGGIPIPLYSDAAAQEMVFVFQNAEIAFAIVEDQEQVDKLLEVKAQCPEARPHLLRRPARPAELHPARTRELREPAGGRARVRRAQPRFLPRRGREGQRQRHRGDVLHLGHDRPPEGRGAHAPEPDHRRAHGRRDGGPDARRGGARVPAAGLDRPEHLLVRAALRRRLLRVVPRIGRDGDDRHARDRADVLLRGAARARGAAHAGHDPDGGRERAQARAVPLLHGARAARRREDPRREGAGGPRRPPAVPDRRLPRLRPVAQRARHEPREDRVHRRRGDRAGSLRLLPLDRHQPQAALRLDRDLGVRVRAARRPGEGRHRRPAGEGRRDQGHGRGRDPHPLAGSLPELLQEPRGHRRGEDERRLVPDRRRRLLRPGRPSQDHRPREGRREARGRYALRAEVPREQAEVLPVHQGGGGIRPRARDGVRVRQHRLRRGRQLGRAAEPRVLGLHRPRQPRRRCSTSCATASRR